MAGVPVLSPTAGGAVVFVGSPRPEPLMPGSPAGVVG